jgi:hypothetical protein
MLTRARPKQASGGFFVEAVSSQLSALSSQPSAISYQLSAISKTELPFLHRIISLLTICVRLPLQLMLMSDS